MTNGEIGHGVSAWAVNEPLIRRAYLFGSRAKGTSRSGSDVDIAIVHDCDPDVRASCESVSMARHLTWQDFGDGWSADLQTRLLVLLHLQPADRSDTRVIWPALKQQRICLYRRGVDFIAETDGSPPTPFLPQPIGRL